MPRRWDAWPSTSLPTERCPPLVSDLSANRVLGFFSSRPIWDHPISFFLIKNCNLLMSELQEKPSALQREHPAFQKLKLIIYFLCLLFTFTGSWYGSRDPIESGSNPVPDTHPIRIPIRIQIRIHNTAFSQQAPGQIFQVDVNGFSSASNIYFMLKSHLFKVKRLPEALIWSRQYTIAFYDKLKFRIKEYKSRFGISSKTDRKATKARTRKWITKDC